MSAPKRKTESKAGATDWIKVATGRIGAIAALITTVGALVMVALNQSAQIQQKLNAMGLFSARHCVDVTNAEIPKTIEYRDWHKMRIKFEGRNSCDEMLGMYVTFVGRVSSAPSFRVRAPHEDLPECGGKVPVQLPNCWDRKKPVAIGKGEWAWEVLPPPITELSDSTQSATISVRWEVRNVDKPDSKPFGYDSAQIEVTNRAARP